MKYKVVLVNHIPKGFIGMNYWASKELGVDFPYPEHIILTLRKLGRATREQTIQHEKIEADLMRNEKLPYHEAHKLALQMEAY